MAPILPPAAFINSLRCPCGGKLEIGAGQACCGLCRKSFGISASGILEFADLAALDEETARELRAHGFELSESEIAQMVQSEKKSLWKSYYSRNRKKTMQHLADYLGRVNCEQVFFLGVGTGREIEYLISFMRLKKVLCSDLSHGALRIIPARLAPYNLELGLFTSDLQRCPVASKDIPIVIVNALHHTRDMHQVIDSLLAEQYHNLFLVEPTDNFLIRLLARRGIARRVEYSGVLPGRLEIPLLKQLCRKHHYRLSLRTQWAFPQDYYRKIFGRPGRFQALFFWLLNGISVLTGPAKLGNFSIAHLSKLNAGHGAGSKAAP